VYQYQKLNLCYHPGTLCFLQEVLGSNLAGVPSRPSKDAPAPVQALQSIHVDLKAFKMAVYGFLISAPVSHFLVSQLQKAFAGKTSPASKLGQIAANSLIVAPIQTASEWLPPCVWSCLALTTGSLPFSLPRLNGCD
jgi:hypothetical protein